MPGIWDRDESFVNEAKSMDRAENLLKGVHVLIGRTIRWSKSTNVKAKTDGYDLFAGEFTVKYSTNPAMTPGSTRSRVILINPGDSDSAKQEAGRQIGDVKSVLAALSGKPVTEIKAGHLKSTRDNGLIFEGKLCICEVGDPKPTQTAGRTFTPVSFRVWSQEAEDQIRANAGTTKNPEPATGTSTLFPNTTPGSVTKAASSPAPAAEELWG